MIHIDRSALVPFAAEQMFLLVNDIESYPEYMDGCVGASILRRDGNVLEARLDLSRGGIKQSFATRNRSQVPHWIELELLEGPFDHFAGRWQFDQLGEAASKVSLKLQFRMSSSLLGAAAGRLFEGVALKLVDALSQRARQLYG